MSHEHSPACPTVRLIFIAATRHFGDVTVTINASEERNPLSTQEVLSIEIEYEHKQVTFPKKALRDIGAVSMNLWFIHEEFSSRVAHPMLTLAGGGPVHLPGQKQAMCSFQAIISQDRLRSIRLAIPKTKNASLQKVIEY